MLEPSAVLNQRHDISLAREIAEENQAARTVLPSAGVAGVSRFEDLDAWKLSAELRDRIVDETARGPASRDRDFVDQIRDSARSVPRNIAEGFGAFKPREFARFTRIARRSLMETRNHLRDGHRNGYFQPNQARELLTLCHRALGATTALLRYLDGCKGVAPTGWDSKDR